MSDNVNSISGQTLNDLVPTHGVSFIDQPGIAATADGSIPVLGLKKDPAADKPAANPALSYLENNAIHWAVQRLTQRLAGSAGPQPSSSGPKSLQRRGASWTSHNSSAEPIRMSPRTANLVSQIDPKAPTRSVQNTLMAFMSLEEDGNSLNFIRKNDIAVIHGLQHRLGIRKKMPAMTLSDKRRLRGPRNYAALRHVSASTSPKLEPVYFHGQQASALRQAMVLNNNPPSPRASKKEWEKALRPTPRFRPPPTATPQPGF